MPDMIIKISVFNIEDRFVGKLSIDLDWKPNESSAGPLINEWSVWDVNSWLNHDIFWDWYGIFDIKSWDVMWLWAQKDSSRIWRHNFILWNPPTSRHDKSHMSGGGYIHEAKNPNYIGMRLKWKVKCLAGCYVS